MTRKTHQRLVIIDLFVLSLLLILITFGIYYGASHSRIPLLLEIGMLLLTSVLTITAFVRAKGFED